MLKRKYILPAAIFAGLLHMFWWLDFAGLLAAAGTSILYGLLVYWSYRYIERKSR